MIGDSSDVAIARARAELARRKFAATLGEIQERLNPRVLIRDAWDEVRDQGGDLAAGAIKSVKDRPGRAAAIGGALALLLARKPIANAIGGLLLPNDDEDQVEEAGWRPDETASALDGSSPNGSLNAQPAEGAPRPATSGDLA